jgi:Zn-dependent protease
MVTINIFWSIINLFPVLPLDGGQILRDVLGPEKIKLTCIVSFITLAVLGTLLWMETRSLYNLMVMLFLGSYTWNLYQQIRER